MAKKQKQKMMAGLMTAVGAVGAFFGVRRLMTFFEERRHEQERQESLHRRMQSLVMDAEGQPHPGEYGSEGTPVASTRYQPVDQPDRQPIPATGMAAPDVMERTDVLDSMQPDTDQDDLRDLAGVLIQYLMSFHSLINLLRSRRAEAEDGGQMVASQTLDPEDRARFQEALDLMELQMPDYARGNLEKGSLHERVYDLVEKVRDTLHNLDYNDDDLFRLNGEVRSTACQVLNELHVGQGSTDLDLVRQMYECS